MVRASVNLFLFALLLIVFVFVIINSDAKTFENPQTPGSQGSRSILSRPYTRQNPIELEYQPIYITPSNIKFMTPNIKKATVEYIPEQLRREYIAPNVSPTGSVAVSSIFEVNMEIVKSLREDTQKSKSSGFIFDVAGRRFGSIGEKLTCKVFETFLERKVMIHYRPDFLRNPLTNKNLELDLFDPNTGIAVEYNGAQHYKFVPTMHDTTDSLNYQLWKDNLKIELCIKAGVILIVVPYTIDTTGVNKNGNIKHIKLSEQQREQKIANFLIPLLKEAMNIVNERKINQ